MDKIVSVIVDIFTQYGILAGILVLVLIVFLIFGKKILDKLSDMVVERLDTLHKKSLETRKKNTPKVKELLNQVLRDSQASRVLLFEYHNGGQNLTGMQFLHVSATMEADKITTAPIGQLLNDIHLSMIPNLISDLQTNLAIYIESVESIREKYPYFYDVFTNNGTKQVVFCAIEGIKNSIGFVCLLFNTKDPIDIQNVRQVLYKNTQKISTLLDFNK